MGCLLAFFVKQRVSSNYKFLVRTLVGSLLSEKSTPIRLIFPFCYRSFDNKTLEGLLFE